MIDPFVLGLWGATALDLLLGDPRWLPHPIRLIGTLCHLGEKLLRRLIPSDTLGGIAIVVLVLGATAGGLSALLYGLSLFSPVVSSGAAVIFLYTSVAMRDLASHAAAVHDALVIEGDDRLDRARGKVGMMVGRDTSELDEQGVVRACVESVAENMSDGVIAPFFWAFVAAVVVGYVGESSWVLPAAAVAAMTYKAVNTMDSMFGYKNERYLYFGKCGARLDDLVNYIPARLSGFFIVLAAFVVGKSMKGSFAVMVRDRNCHASPNAGYPEAAMAGALGVKLGGANVYFGEILQKPTIGNEVKELEPADIRSANKLMYVAALLTFTLFSICAIVL